jgi:leader peptidase (prepilin peptidase)/N-methyltransferase
MTLAIMDWRTFLLPDALTLGLLWATLVVAALGGLPLSATDAILGAAVGYLVLFLPAWGFERVTGRTGMAHGDFKLMAAVGAAAGPDQVIVVLLFASLLGIAVAWKAQRWVPRGSDIGASDIAPGAVPFGPMIAAAAMANLVWPIESLALQW